MAFAVDPKCVESTVGVSDSDTFENCDVTNLNEVGEEKQTELEKDGMMVEKILDTLINMPVVKKNTRRSGSRASTLNKRKKNVDEQHDTSFDTSSLATLIQQLIKNVSDVSKKVDNINNMFHEFGQQLGALESRLVKVEGLQSTVDGMRARLDRMEQTRRSTSETTYEREEITGESLLRTQPLLKSMQRQVDQLEQDKRNDFIILSGNAVADAVQKKRTTETMEEVASNLIDALSWNKWNINMIREVSLLKGERGDNILVKLSDIRIKKHLFVAFFKVKNGKPFYLNEFLTKKRSSLLYELRQIRRQYPDKVKSVFSQNGHLFCVSVNEPYKKIAIDDENDLKDLKSSMGPLGSGREGDFE